MHYSKNIVLLLFCIFASCSTSPTFNQKVWMENNDVNDSYNPRAKMVKDVIKNHLKIGMSRKSVFTLLGKPYHEGLEPRLPDHMILPDSISFENDDNLKPKNAAKAIAEINNFYSMHAKPVMLIKYPVGWSIIDPNFLVIRLNKKGLVDAFWIEQG